MSFSDKHVYPVRRNGRLRVASLVFWHDLKTWFFSEIDPFRPRSLPAHPLNHIWPETRHLGGQSQLYRLTPAFEQIWGIWVKVC